MFRIRRIYDDIIPVNRDALRQVKEIFRVRFPGIRKAEADQLGEILRNPFKQRFRAILFVAENMGNRKVQAFALLLHEPEIGFCFLDWIAAAKGNASGGIGGALYQRVRQEAVSLNSHGLFFECLPDNRSECPNEALFRENQARLKFYERFGARPIIGSAYETPVRETDTCLPHLVYDGLENQKPPAASFVRRVVRAILERKYQHLCSPEYVSLVADSFTDPVRIRDFRYAKPEVVESTVARRSREPIALIINEKHKIHHIHERGYVESPVRIRSILSEIDKSGLFERIQPREFPDKHIQAIHDPGFITYIRKACEEMQEGKSLYPYVFPIRNKTRPPKESAVLPGYYCIDTFTPINRNAYPAARSGVNCALTAAKEILEGRRIAYALVRPPGHHAERCAFGGFCYFNNNAIAAQYLRDYGRVAILDIDYHHGNGQQDIFYRRSDVLTISIHGHPKFAYPYFTGFDDEFGEGEGEGFNLNLPLPETVTAEQYRKALEKAIRRIIDYQPDFLVTALGFDTAKGDPTGTWCLSSKDFYANGRMIGETGFPLLVIQEGGYRTRTLGVNAHHFFDGLSEAAHRSMDKKRQTVSHLQNIVFRYEPKSDDAERIRRLVEITGFFRPDEVEVAVELVNERLAKGAASGYHFVFAWQYGRMAGYSCYGPIACTTASYDLYWIAVSPDYQGRGLGRLILKETERLIREVGGARIYVETSQRVQYLNTRAFYEHCGYRLASVLEDFYASGDSKATYCKVI